ncbi:hypothetical protein DPX16_16349 [Anabarilius grahami]|uniref:Uncharacterized protein n=1 Tax=Anabarilius grahami TaxID=495550 RepID=A0A3N0XL70_ANAGA|nr:hypothetical protein DPX16_16349 [Anabarilius grahami]
MQLRNPSYSLPSLLLSPPPEYRIDTGSANSVCRDQPCVTGAPSRTANFPVHQQASAISTASARERCCRVKKKEKKERNYSMAHPPSSRVMYNEAEPPRSETSECVQRFLNVPAEGSKTDSK